MNVAFTALAKLFLEAFASSLLGFVQTWLKNREDVQAQRDDAVQTAADETQSIITETADARSQVSVPAAAGDLARELRDRAAAITAGTGGNIES